MGGKGTMAETYQDLIQQIGTEETVDPTLINAVVRTESGYNPTAVSPKGAVGLMQLMPETGKQYGVGESDLIVPEKNIRGGTRYLKFLLNKFKGDRNLALAAYNAGEETVERYGGIPPYPETQQYVRKVMALLNQQTPPAPIGSTVDALRPQLAKFDPRTPIIQLEGVLSGLQEDSLKQAMNDPAAQERLFASGLRRAERLDPKLRLSSGLDAYTATLTEATKDPTNYLLGPPSSLAGEAPGKPKPPRNILPHTFGELVNVPISIVKGMTIDNISGLFEVGKDIIKATGLDTTPHPTYTFGGISFNLDNEQLNTVVDKYMGKGGEFLAEAQTGTAGFARSLAGFFFLARKLFQLAATRLIPETTRRIVGSVQKPLLLFEESGKLYDDAGEVIRAAGVPRRVFNLADQPVMSAAEQHFRRFLAGVGAFGVAEAIRINPDEKLWIDSIDALARGIDPQDPEPLKAELVRILSGETDLKTAKARLATRFLHGVEGTDVGILFDGVFEVFKGLSHARRVRLAEETRLRTEAGRLDRATEAERLARQAEQLARPEFEPTLGEGVDAAGNPLPPGQSTVELQAAEDIARQPTLRQRTLARELMEETTIREVRLQTPAQQSVEIQRLQALVTNTPGEIEQAAVQTQLEIYQRAVEKVENMARVTTLAEQVAERIQRGHVDPLISAEGLPRSTRWMDSLLDEIQGETEEIVRKGKPSTRLVKKSQQNRINAEEIQQELSVPTPPPVEQFPTSLPAELLEGTDELFKLIDKPLAETGLTPRLHAFLKGLREQFGTETGRAVVMGLLQGGIGLGAASAMLDAEEGGQVDTMGMDPNVVKGAAFLFGMGLGGKSFRGAAMGLRAMRAELAPELRSAISTVRLAPAARTRIAGQALVERSGQTRFDLVNDARDLRELVHAKEASVARGTAERLGVDIASDAAIADRIGGREAQVAYARELAKTPEEFAKRVDGLVALATEIPKALNELATRALLGEPVGTELLRHWNTAGGIGEGLDTARRTFGAAMDRFRAAGYGEFTQLVNEGTATGIREPATASTQRLARLILATPEEELLGVAHRATTVRGRDGVVQLFLSNLVGAITTPTKALLGNTSALALQIAETGMVANGLRTPGLRRLLGEYEVGSPEVGEATAMLGAIRESFGDLARVVTRTALTGKTEFAELGATHSIGPAFTRDAFPRLAASLDGIGSLVDVPHAGNILSWIGSFADVLGTRALVTVDELTSFLMERAALAGRAHRYRVQGEAQGLWRTQAEAEEAVAKFRERPPDDVLAQIRRDKKVVTFMNDLMDEQGGFAAIRHLTGQVESAMNQSATLRVTFPFLRAMTNIFTYTAEHFPLLNQLSEAFRSELKHSDPAIRAAAEGRLMMSYTLGSLFAAMGATGLVVGNITSDKRYREELARAGRAPNSMYFDGMRIGIDTSQPLGSLLSIFASIGAAAQGPANPAENNAVHAALLGLGELLKNQTFAGRLFQLWSEFEDRRLTYRAMREGPIEAVVQTIDDLYLRAVLPLRAIQQFEQVLDPYRRVYDGELQKVQSRLPVFSEGLKQETDIFGRPRYMGGGLSADTVDNVGRVIFGVPVEMLPVDELSKVLTDKGIIINDPPAHYTQGHTTVPITNEERQRLRELIAQPPGLPPLKDVILALAKTEYWKQTTPGPDGTADLLVKQQISSYTQYARAVLLAERRDIGTRLTTKAMQTGFLPIQGVQ
jgi:hypothetical protein